MPPAPPLLSPSLPVIFDDRAAGRARPRRHSHGVQFYEDDRFLVDMVVPFLEEGLADGASVVVVATTVHRAAFAAGLEARGRDVEAACRAGQLLLLDAEETLERLMVDGHPTAEAMAAVIGTRLTEASRDRPTSSTRVYGEMVDLLWRRGRGADATTLEALWNDLEGRHGFALLCAYSMDHFHGDERTGAFVATCDAHTHVFPTEQFAQRETDFDRLREISLLQQRALALQSEIEQRKTLETALRAALDERTRAEEALRLREHELADFIENAAEGIHWVGPDGIVLWANRAELALLGCARDEFIGHHISEFHVDPPVIADILARLARNETLSDYEARLRRKDGEIVHVSISSNVHQQDGKFAHTRCFTRDITARKRTHEELKRLLTVTSSLSEACTIEQVIDVVMDEAVKSTGAYAGVLFLVDEEGQHLTLVRAFGYTDDARVPFSKMAVDSSVPIAEAVRSSRPVFLSSRRAYQSYPVVAAEARSESLAAIPLVVRKRPIGVLGLSFAEPRTFDQAERGFLGALANQCAQALERARLYDETHEAARRKDEFLAMLGHELRNPLAPILSALELMKLRGRLETETQNIVERQVHHLVRLVDDLLDVSRITRGKVTLQRQRVELSEIAGKAVEMTMPLLEQRSHRLSIDVPADGLPIDADGVRLAQVLGNLLTNAAKYTDPGGQISLRGWREADDVIVSVKDNGIGIAPDQLPKMFELFAQEGRTLDRSQGGLGIGLTLARRLVELHGGSLAAHSLGRGTGCEFTVRLPASSAAHSASTQDLIGAPNRATSRRVLIVDDNKDAADSLGELLTDLGHEVAVASGGAEALVLVEEFHPCTALIDIGLPLMNGHELAQVLRERQTSRLHLIALTGYGQESDRARSRAAGFDVHLVKPVDVDTLLRVISEGGSAASAALSS